jgi:hypothetical protein
MMMSKREKSSRVGDTYLMMHMLSSLTLWKSKYPNKLHPTANNLWPILPLLLLVYTVTGQLARFLCQDPL